MRLSVWRSLVLLLLSFRLSAQAPETATSRVIISVVPNPDGAVDLSLAAVGEQWQIDWSSILETTLPCEWEMRTVTATHSSARCPNLLTAQRGNVDGWLKFQPLITALHREGYHDIDLSVLLASVPQPPATPQGWEMTRESGMVVYHAASHSLSDLPADMYLRTGATPPAPRPHRGLRVPLLLVLCVPGVVAFLLLARSRRGQPRPITVWFAWIHAGNWFLWLLLLPPSEIVARVSDAFAGGTSRMLAGMLLLIVPPLTGISLAYLILEGDPRLRVAYLKRALLPDAARALLFSPAAIAPALIFADEAVPYAGLAVGFVGAFALLALIMRAHSGNLRLVEAGEFRDRVMQMAKEAGARLNSIWLLHDRLPQEANAFASPARRQILLTENLLQELPKREVDAFIAHEIGHLRGRLAISVPKFNEAYAIGSFFSLLMKPFGGGLAYWEPTLLLSGVVGLFLATAISRGFEYEADARSARLTKDPFALMAGLGRLAGTRRAELAWGKLEGVILSHPSFRARVLRLAAPYRISEWRALEILQDPDSLYGPADQERLPSLAARYVVPANDVCFSPMVRGAHAMSTLWLMRSALVLPLIGLSYAITLITGTFLLQLGLFALVPVPVLLSALYLIRWWHRHFLHTMARRIAPKLPADFEGEFVGLWPGDTPTPVYGFFAWDIGRLAFSGDHLMYAGERARFSIPRADVMSVQMVDTPGTALRQNSLVVHWRHGTFTIQPVAGASLKLVRRLHDQWIQSANQPPASLPPEIAQVYPAPHPDVPAGGSAARVPLLIEAAFIGVIGLALQAVLPENPLNLVAVSCASLLYLGMVLPRLLQAARPPAPPPPPAGGSRLDRLKEEEDIATAACHFINEAQKTPDQDAADLAYAKAHEECDRLLKMNPRNLLGLKALASCLTLQALRKPREVADRLYGEADEKLSLAVSLVPGDTDLMVRLGYIRLRRGVLSVNGKSAESLSQARALFENVLRERPTFTQARIFWAHALSEQSKRNPGPETDQALSSALLSFDSAAGYTDDDQAQIVRGQAAILFAQAMRASGERATSLLRQAKEKFLDSERREPGTGAYRAACVCARLNQLGECRQWLEKSHEPGVLVTRDELAAEPHFEPVRASEWFQSLLVSAPHVLQSSLVS